MGSAEPNHSGSATTAVPSTTRRNCSNHLAQRAASSRPLTRASKNGVTSAAARNVDATTPATGDAADAAIDNATDAQHDR